MTSENENIEETKNTAFKTVTSVVLRGLVLGILFFALNLMVGALHGFHQFLKEMQFI